MREYERASTTAVDAYLRPVAARYLVALGAAADDAGLPAPLVMRSSGGVATLDEAAAHPALILVGPAGGVVAAERVAALAGVEHAIAFDMGGTSTDVCLIANSVPSGRRTGRRGLPGPRPDGGHPRSGRAAARSSGGTPAARSASARAAPARSPARRATAAVAPNRR